MKFRGKETNGWRVIEGTTPLWLETNLNRLMQEYEFLDCQYSVVRAPGNKTYKGIWYTALVLLGDKNES